jgi:hypothetical protein
MMTRYRLLAAAMVAIALLTVQTPFFGQTAVAAASKKPKHTRSKVHRETAEQVQLRELRESLEVQQKQIDSLKSQVAAKAGDLTNAQQAAADAQAQAAAAAAAAAQAQASDTATATRVDAVSSSVTDLKTTTTGVTDKMLAGQKKIEDEVNSPTTLRYKGVRITPVAFFAFEAVWRQHSVNSDINTPFNAIPFPGSNQGHVSELNFSGRQSRLGGLFEGDAGRFKLSGYFEADFLSSGVTSNANQSNSYTLRQRQIWGKAETSSGFAVTGGQMWSLVTENRKGTDARTEILPNTIDPQYLVGYSWERQPGIRVQQRFGDYKTGAFTAAMSLENAQITNFTAASGTAGAVPANYYFAGVGQSGGLFNAFNGTYANNVAPDLVVKGAFDRAKMHVEVGGVARFLRDYYYPITSVTDANVYTYSKTPASNTALAGGAYGSVRVSPSKYFEVAAQAMGGQGVGRYGSAQLADATLKPNGVLEPIRNYHGLLSLETHPSAKLDVFAYYGGEYAQRTVYTTATGAQIGYGARNLADTGCYAIAANPGSNTGGSPSTSSCNSPTRYIQEPMVGFIYRVVNSPKFGKLQYSATFSYLQRNLWSGVGNTTTPTGPRAEDPMVHVSMRYYIP